MITQLELSQITIDWLELTTGIRFYLAAQDIARSSRQYGTLRIIQSRKRAIPEMTVTDTIGDDTTVDEKIRLWNQTTFSIIVYKDSDVASALDITDTIAVNLQTSYSEEYFSVNGMGLSNHSDIRGFDMLVKNVMEPRANIDIEFNIHQEIINIVDNIEGVSIDNALDNTVANPLTQTTITQRTP